MSWIGGTGCTNNRLRYRHNSPFSVHVPGERQRMPSGSSQPSVRFSAMTLMIGTGLVHRRMKKTDTCAERSHLLPLTKILMNRWKKATRTRASRPTNSYPQVSVESTMVSIWNCNARCAPPAVHLAPCPVSFPKSQMRDCTLFFALHTCANPDLFCSFCLVVERSMHSQGGVGMDASSTILLSTRRQRHASWSKHSATLP